MEYKQLKALCLKMRRDILEMIGAASSGHPGRLAVCGRIGGRRLCANEGGSEEPGGSGQRSFRFE